MRRRELLAATGTALTTAVAGCGGTQNPASGGSETGPDSPSAAAEAYVRAVVNGNTERSEQLSHPEAIRGVTAASGGGELQSIDPEVVDEDLSPADVGDYEEAGIVADINRVEEAALVRVQFEATINSQQVDSAYLVLTARQDDEWLILDRGVPPSGE